MHTLTVNGMHCGNCQKAVTEAMAKIPGVTEARVDLLKKEASWKDTDPNKPVAIETIKEAISAIGFDPE